MWKVFTLCIALSIGMVLWLGYEVGVFFPKRVEASEATIENATPDKLSGIEKTLQARTKALMEREEALNRRERGLVEKEKLLTNQLGRYEKVIEDLKSRLNDSETTKNARVEAFRQVYEKMEPKKAAKIFDEMDVAISSQILGGIKGDKAAEILSQMSPEKARAITERYLGKRHLAGSKVNEVKQEDKPEAVESAVPPTKGGGM